MHGLLTNLGEACVLCKVRDVAVHLTVNLYVLYNLVAICLEAAVHVVELYAGDFAGRPVVKL